MMDVSNPLEVLKTLADTFSGSGELTLFSNATALSPSASIFCEGSATIQPFVTFDGLIFLGDGVSIGPYTLLRGPLYIGRGSTIGSYCEIVRSFVGENTAIAHKNLIPDSIIRDRVWLAGGVTICNVRLDKRPVRVGCDYSDRFGAIIEDDVRLGVSVVVMPGTIVKKGTCVVGPCTIRGTVR